VSIEYVPRAEWRGPGRPKTPVDPEVKARLERTFSTGTVAILPVPEDTDPAEVRKALAQLRRAAEDLGLRLKVQPRRAAEIVAAGQMSFYAEES
jgi:hypothetical protein